MVPSLVAVELLVSLLSPLSSSKLFETDVLDGELDPVLAGDCIGESLFVTSTELALDFSPPVIASDIARRPAARDFLLKKEFECDAAGDGDTRPVDEVSLPGRAGELATASMLGES